MWGARWAGPLWFLAGCGMLLWSSSDVGPSFSELGRLDAVDRAGDLVWRMAQTGMGSVPRADFARLSSEGTLATLVGGWSLRSIGRVGLLDPLTSARLAWLLLGAAIPALVWALLRPSRGSSAAAVAAGVALLLPRLVHGATITAPGVTVAAFWLVVLVGHVRSMDGHPLRWGLIQGAALGIGLALERATLWVLLLVVIHAAWHTAPRRTGFAPLPTSLVMAVVVAPIAAFVASPDLWGASSYEVVRWFFTPVGAEIVPATFGGTLVQQAPLPGAYTVVMLALTTPGWVVVAALVGTGVLVHEGLARRFATGSLRPASDPTRSLVLLGAFATVCGPMLAPDALATFPPRTELALPFIAMLAGVGVDRVLRGWEKRRRWGVLGCLLVSLGVIAFRSPPTRAALFAPWVGGAETVAVRAWLPVTDGSELAVLAPALEQVGPVAAPGVPERYFDRLQRSGRTQSRVEVSRAAPMRLERNPGKGVERRAEVRRGGAVLWAVTPQ